MRVLLAIGGARCSDWSDAFAAALPDAQIDLAAARPDSVDYVVAWRPHPQTFVNTRVRKAIFNLGAGADALLATPSLPADVPIYRLEDAGMAEQMAEYVTHAVLRAYREFDAYREAQDARSWKPRPPAPKSSFRVGLLGVGVLGRAVARALAVLEFPLAGYARTPRQTRGVEMWIGPDALRDFLAASRVLVCLLPATPQTRNLLDRRTLGYLPRGAHVINVSRGDLIVDEDLIALLDSGHVASATLDVFRTEPLPADHPFWHHPGVTLTPHVAAATLITESTEQVAAKIRSLERGVAPAGLVDRARGY